MPTLINQLISVLENEVEQHALLLTAAHTMNMAAKKQIIPDIKNAARSYEECINSIAELEERRLSISDELCKDKLQSLPHASLLIVIGSIPEPDKTKITTLRTKLQNAIQSLSIVNNENRIILTESLHILQKTFELIRAQSGTHHEGYKRLGKKDTRHTPNQIINSVV